MLGEVQNSTTTHFRTGLLLADLQMTSIPTCTLCDFTCGTNYNQPRDACILMLIIVSVVSLLVLVLIFYLIGRFCCVQKRPSTQRILQRYGLPEEMQTRHVGHTGYWLGGGE